MPKQIPDCPKKPTPDGEASREFSLRLMTPMFGGGVDSRVNDIAYPIRATSIRGQLQFWWRATVGSRFESPKELRSAQTELWGSTELASRVDVIVGGVKADTPQPCAKFQWDANARSGQGAWKTEWQSPFGGHNSALRYVLFPFQGKAPPPNRNAACDVEPANCIQRASFRLIIRCPHDLWSDLEPAVWAWSNFGGVGGRTRRGYGAVICEEFAPPSIDGFDNWLVESAKRYRLTVGDRIKSVTWPQFAGGVWRATRCESSISAWNRVVTVLREFRQGSIGRNPGNPRPGRSRFPEPETIRRYAKRRNTRHQRLEHIPDNAVPRAELGLPIVFQFPGGRGDPGNTTLCPRVNGEIMERMGSPLAFRPIGTKDGKAVATIIRLRTPVLTGSELTGEGVQQPVAFNEDAIRRPSLATYRDSPLAYSSAGSAVDSLVAFAQNDKNQFQRVTCE